MMTGLFSLQGLTYYQHLRIKQWKSNFLILLGSKAEIKVVQSIFGRLVSGK